MIKLKHILHQLPEFIFWKDKASNYRGGNGNFLKSAGLSSSREILGKNDYQMPWKLYADEYRSADQNVIYSKKEIYYEAYHKDAYGNITLAIVNKKPLYDEKSTVMGIIGIFSKVPLKHTKTNKASLSKRQKEVLMALTNGLSSRKIAAKLNLSQRTIEYYIEIIHSKLGSQNRAELIKKAFLLGFFANET